MASRYAVFYYPTRTSGKWVVVCQMRFLLWWDTYHRSFNDSEEEALTLWKQWVADEVNRRSEHAGEQRTDWKP